MSEGDIEANKTIEDLFLVRKLNLIKLAVANYYGVEEYLIDSLHTNRTISKVRHVFQYIAIENDFSIKQLSKSTKRNVSTVTYGHSVIKSRSAWDKELRAELDALMEIVENKCRILKSEIEGSDKYYYIDLSTNISFKIGTGKAIVLSGFNSDELREFIKFNNLSDIKPVRCNNSNLQIIIKK